jgi:hypothetical protein
VPWLSPAPVLPASLAPFPARRYDAVMLYLFVSSAEPNVRAFTSDPAGANLPTASAPWKPSGSGAAIPVRDPVDPVSRAGPNYRTADMCSISGQNGNDWAVR